MDVMTDVSGASWGADEVVAEFATHGYTDEGEAHAMGMVAEWAEGAVLDIGVGGGRTTGLLLPRARSYVGVDLAAEMVELASGRFPDTDLRVGDARDLDGLPDRGFDLVVFSFNGIDNLGREDRARALASMARVLAPGGRVLFSSLNLDGVSYDEKPWWVSGGLRDLRARRHLAHGLRHPASVVRSVRNYRRNRALSEDGDGWGLRPMRAHEFRFVVHFATLGTTVADVRAAGLEVVAAYGDHGRPVDPTEEHCDADYVHYVCRATIGA